MDGFVNKQNREENPQIITEKNLTSNRNVLIGLIGLIFGLVVSLADLFLKVQIKTRFFVVSS